MELNEKVKIKLEELNITEEVLAKELGISVKRVGRFLAGEVNLERKVVIDRLNKFLDLNNE